MGKHTPGDWFVDLMEEYENGTDLVVLDADGFPIATIEATPILHDWSVAHPGMKHWGEGMADGRTLRHRSREEVEANARLIRHASDHAVLLAALTSSAARIERSGDLIEICVSGLRYATTLDETGCPIIGARSRAAIEKIMVRE